MGILIVILPAIAYLIAIALACRVPTLSLAIYAFAPVTDFASMTFARNTSEAGAANQDFTRVSSAYRVLDGFTTRPRPLACSLVVRPRGDVMLGAGRT